MCRLCQCACLNFLPHSLHVNIIYSSSFNFTPQQLLQCIVSFTSSSCPSNFSQPQSTSICVPGYITIWSQGITIPVMQLKWNFRSWPQCIHNFCGSIVVVSISHPFRFLLCYSMHPKNDRPVFEIPFTTTTINLFSWYT